MTNEQSSVQNPGSHNGWAGSCYKKSSQHHPVLIRSAPCHVLILPHVIQYMINVLDRLYLEVLYRSETTLSLPEHHVVLQTDKGGPVFTQFNRVNANHS